MAASLPPIELEELSKDESILLGNKVRDALHESSVLKEVVLSDLPSVRKVCNEKGYSECVSKIDNILKIANGD